MSNNTLTQAQMAVMTRQLRMQVSARIEPNYYDGMTVMYQIGKTSKKWIFKVGITLNENDLYDITLYRFNNDIYSDDFGNTDEYCLTDDGYNYGGWYADMLDHIQYYYDKRHELDWKPRQ